jgi:hypothetical protein
MAPLEDMIRRYPQAPPSMNPRARRRVLLVLGALVLLLMIGGAANAWFNRHESLCSDGKPPVRQRLATLNQIDYHCQNGEIVRR